jgi:magnesium chelatase subunit H
VDALRETLLGGNAARYGTLGNVHATISVDDHVAREPYLTDIERVWGPAPGKQLSDGRQLLVLGERFGNVFVGFQPGFGIEGDPMRLLFNRELAATHAFSACYRWLREDFAAHAVLHFGTHGALEFMPGKQVGLDETCWPDRMIGDLPNIYLYASNNPAEGALAKRRGAATLVSYLTPPVANAGLYRGLLDLKSSLDRWRSLEPDTDHATRDALVELIQSQAAAVDLAPADPDRRPRRQGAPTRVRADPQRPARAGATDEHDGADRHAARDVRGAPAGPPGRPRDDCAHRRGGGTPCRSRSC